MGQFLQQMMQGQQTQGGTPQFGALSSNLGNMNAPQGATGQSVSPMGTQGIQQPNTWTPKPGGMK